MTVAALYIDGGGPYPRMAGVDCWDEARDARNYPGPWPVVAHPPCAPWGRLKHFAKRQGERHLALVALAQVRAYGGVLEHPADSSLWSLTCLPLPGQQSDAFGGRTVEVCQCEWGHVTRKRTWLYAVRTTAFEVPPFPGREPTHSICNGRGKNLKSGTVRLRASAEQARLSPPEFAAYLVRLAAAAAEQRRVA